MIQEETDAWQEMPAEKRQQIIVILVQMLLREVTAMQEAEGEDEGRE